MANYVSPNGEELSTAQLLVRLLAVYSIRRQAASVQNAKPLAYIPPLARVDVVCRSRLQRHSLTMHAIQPFLRDNLTRAFEQERQGRDSRLFVPSEREMLDNVHSARLSSVVPGLALYASPGELTWKHIARHKWHEQPLSSVVYENMEVLEASSCKPQTLRTFLERWDSCETFDGGPEQLVIMSQSPYICFVLVCVSSTLFPLSFSSSQDKTHGLTLLSVSRMAGIPLRMGSCRDKLFQEAGDHRRISAAMETNRAPSCSDPQLELSDHRTRRHPQSSTPPHTHGALASCSSRRPDQRSSASPRLYDRQMLVLPVHRSRITD